MVGTGCADMDETVPAKLTTNNKEARLFQQIANELSAQGFAVFRYNKRGVISTKNGPRFNYKIWNRLSRDDLIEDGICAAQKLLALTNFKKKDLIILGHSEGTIIGTEVAIHLGGKIKSLILLGVVSRSMKEQHIIRMY
jgi:alpha-beta hydrolase superfamily lysophospholipase